MRVIEHFLSIQGEGAFAGRRAFFLRLAGCNFRCAGFGVEGFFAGRKTLGCDTQRATFGAQNAAKITASEALGWLQPACKIAAPLVVITGGEPLLQQRSAELIAFVRAVADLGCEIQFETNGTIAPVSSACERAHFAVGYKTAASGEANRLNLAAICGLIERGEGVFFKVVICAQTAATAPLYEGLFRQIAQRPPCGQAAVRGKKSSEAAAACVQAAAACVEEKLPVTGITPPGGQAAVRGKKTSEAAAEQMREIAVSKMREIAVSKMREIAQILASTADENFASAVDENFAADAANLARKAKEFLNFLDQFAAAEPLATTPADTTAATPADTTAERAFCLLHERFCRLGAFAEIALLRALFCAQRVFLMPQGATRAELAAAAPAVAQAAILLGCEYSDRCHIRLWDDKEGV